MSFKCVQSYNDWEVAALREDTDHQIELEEMNEKSQKYLRSSIQHDKKRSY
jgi:hypothetical protein